MDHDTTAGTHPNRHGVLGMLGALGALAAGVTGRPAGAAQALDCVVTPEITEGPFFIDERLNRSDLTRDTTDPGVRSGTPLRLALHVYAVRGAACVPLEGAQVDLWHTDATGLYSDVAQLNTRGQRFLRGYQVTGRAGAVAFSTIFPGWYPGRTPHIHVKVRTYSPARNVAHELTSQLYFDDAVTNAILARGAYNARGARDTTNARDELFDRTMVVPLTRTRDGYGGTFNLGLRLS
jgi:protocatechuate 3,4-dioxygenase beta subunit